MDSLVLRDPSSGSTARIASSYGFNCYRFTAIVDGQPVEILNADPDFPSPQHSASRHGVPILFPFPNRIRGGQYSWNGRDYHIPANIAKHDPQGNAIHGFCLDRPWRAQQSDMQTAVGEFQLSIDAPELRDAWPADFRLVVQYRVQGTSLRADVQVTNPDDVPLPWGFGTHPYFRVPLSAESAAEHCLVQASPTQQWMLEDSLPTGALRTVPPEKDLREGIYFDQLHMDDVLTGMPPQEAVHECAIMDERAGLQVSQLFDRAFRELVVFTPPHREAVCLEPYTCITDAINLQQAGIDAGLRVLEPGGEFRTWFEIRAGRIIA